MSANAVVWWQTAHVPSRSVRRARSVASNAPSCASAWQSSQRVGEPWKVLGAPSEGTSWQALQAVSTWLPVSGSAASACFSTVNACGSKRSRSWQVVHSWRAKGPFRELAAVRIRVADAARVGRSAGIARPEADEVGGVALPALDVGVGDLEREARERVLLRRSLGRGLAEVRVSREVADDAARSGRHRSEVRDAAGEAGRVRRGVALRALARRGWRRALAEDLQRVAVALSVARPAADVAVSPDEREPALVPERVEILPGRLAVA